MHIKYKQYTIEKAEKHHSNLLASWWNDGNIMSYFGYPLGMNVTEDDVISELDNDQQKLYHRLMICADNTYVGETYYQHLDNETAKIGIRICNHTLQNKGMGRIILSISKFVITSYIPPM
jgi:RimJ/RimL family protein N-acetyltransferase